MRTKGRPGLLALHTKSPARDVARCAPRSKPGWMRSESPSSGSRTWPTETGSIPGASSGVLFRACPRSQNAKTPRRAFSGGAFLMAFLAGYPVLPIQRSILSRRHSLPAPLLPTTSERNVTKRTGEYPENEAGKTVTHYTFSQLSPRGHARLVNCRAQLVGRIFALGPSILPVAAPPPNAASKRASESASHTVSDSNN